MSITKKTIIDKLLRLDGNLKLSKEAYSQKIKEIQDKLNTLSKSENVKTNTILKPGPPKIKTAPSVIDLGPLLSKFNNIINSFNYDIDTKKQIGLHLCSDLIYNKVELLSQYEFILINNEFKKKLIEINQYNITNPDLNKLIKLFNNNTEHNKILLAIELFNQATFNLPKQTVNQDYKENYYNKVYGIEYLDSSIKEPRFYNKLKEDLFNLIHAVLKEETKLDKLKLVPSKQPETAKQSETAKQPETALKTDPATAKQPETVLKTDTSAITNTVTTNDLIFKLHLFINKTFTSNTFNQEEFNKINTEINTLNNQELLDISKLLFNEENKENTLHHLLNEKIQSSEETKLTASIKNYFDKLILIRIELDKLIDKETSDKETSKISNKLNLTLHANKLKNDLEKQSPPIELELKVATDILESYEGELDNLLEETRTTKIKELATPNKASEKSLDPKITNFIDLKKLLLEEPSSTDKQFSEFIKNNQYYISLLRDSNNKFIFDLYCSILENILSDVLPSTTVTDKLTEIINQYTKNINDTKIIIRDVLYLIPEDVQNMITSLIYEMLLTVFDVSATPDTATTATTAATTASATTANATKLLSNSSTPINERLLEIGKLKKLIDGVKQEFNNSIRGFNTKDVDNDTLLNPILFNIMYLSQLSDLLEHLINPTLDIIKINTIEKPTNAADIPELLKEHLKKDIKSGKAKTNLNNTFSNEEDKNRYINMKIETLYQNILEEIDTTLKQSGEYVMEKEKELLIEKMEEIKNVSDFFIKIEGSTAAIIDNKYAELKYKPNIDIDDIYVLKHFLLIFIEIKIYLQYS